MFIIRRCFFASKFYLWNFRASRTAILTFILSRFVSSIDYFGSTVSQCTFNHRISICQHRYFVSLVHSYRPRITIIELLAIGESMTSLRGHGWKIMSNFNIMKNLLYLCNTDSTSALKNNCVAKLSHLSLKRIINASVVILHYPEIHIVQVVIQLSPRIISV